MKKLTITKFRRILEDVVEGNAYRSRDAQSVDFLDVVYEVERMSDEELLKAKLYADFGIDSRDLAEMLTFIEFGEGIPLADDFRQRIGTGVSLTVQKLLDAVNSK